MTQVSEQRGGKEKETEKQNKIQESQEKMMNRFHGLIMIIKVFTVPNRPGRIA